MGLIGLLWATVNAMDDRAIVWVDTGLCGMISLASVCIYVYVYIYISVYTRDPCLFGLP